MSDTTVAPEHTQGDHPFEATVVAFVGSDTHHLALMEAWDHHTGLSSAKERIRVAIEAAQAYEGEAPDQQVAAFVSILTLDRGVDGVLDTVAQILGFDELPPELLALIVAIQAQSAAAIVAADETVAAVREAVISRLLEEARGITEGVPEAIAESVHGIQYPHHESATLQEELEPIQTALNECDELTEGTATLAERLAEALRVKERSFVNPLDFEFHFFNTLKEVTTPPSGDEEASPDTIAPTPWLVVIDLPSGSEEQGRIALAFQTAAALEQGLEVVVTRLLPEGEDVWGPFLKTIGEEEGVTTFADSQEESLWKNVVFDLLSQ
jgi:hypothetical protein